MTRIALVLLCTACASSASPRSSPGAKQSSSSPAILGAQGAIPLARLDGAPVQLAQYGAEVTVIALWATWCGPCVDELPRLEALRRAYHGDRRISIIAVSIDSQDKIEQMKALAARVNYPVLIDSQGALQKKLIEGSASVPKTFIIDSAFHVLLDDGFVANQSTDRFVKEKQALITRARSGAFTEHMAPIEHENRAIPLQQTVKPNEGANLYFDAMDEKGLEALTHSSGRCLPARALTPLRQKSTGWWKQRKIRFAQQSQFTSFQKTRRRASKEPARQTGPSQPLQVSAAGMDARPASDQSAPAGAHDGPLRNSAAPRVPPRGRALDPAGAARESWLA
jgi:thiol-disulfide isomerase/thioredoxin